MSVLCSPGGAAVIQAAALAGALLPVGKFLINPLLGLLASVGRLSAAFSGGSRLPHITVQPSLSRCLTHTQWLSWRLPMATPRPSLGFATVTACTTRISLWKTLIKQSHYLWTTAFNCSQPRQRAERMAYVDFANSTHRTGAYGAPHIMPSVMPHHAFRRWPDVARRPCLWQPAREYNQARIVRIKSMAAPVR